MKKLIILLTTLLFSCGGSSEKKPSPNTIKESASSWASCEIKDKSTQKFSRCFAHRLTNLNDSQKQNEIKDALQGTCDELNKSDNIEGHFSRNSKCSKTPNTYHTHGCLQSTTTPGSNMVLQQFTLNFGFSFEQAKESCNDLKEQLSQMPSQMRDRMTVEWVKL